MLPSGKPLTVVLVGKTGNGKSSAGNLIVGKEIFGVSDSAQSVTTSCQIETRKDKREITVIDTPGIMDTATVKKMRGTLKDSSRTDKAKGAVMHFWYRKDQKEILTELAKMFVMAPKGFDAILLLVKYGTRFTVEDAEALKMLQKFLGEEATKYMILLLTQGDQAEAKAQKKNVPVDKCVSQWVDGMEDWVKTFIHNKIGDRIVLCNGNLHPESKACERMLSKLIKAIDKMSGGNPFVQSELQKQLDADELAEDGHGIDIDTLKEILVDCDRQLKESGLSDKERKDTQKSRDDIIRKINAFDKAVQNVKDQIEETRGGCYPGSAVFVDVLGRRRQMESLQVGEKVQVVTKNEIRSEPVITFIHCQPEVMQEFLKITTLKKKILKITEDHLLFIEKEGQALAIPAREVNIGDTVYVRGDQDEVEKDAVQSIRPVFEKGVYAPVTLSGTLLVNDVHTSCYFDVLSHEWSHRAMGVARAVYHVSPWMVQWISNIGQEDGFPGWCRLAHKMLTFMD